MEQNTEQTRRGFPGWAKLMLAGIALGIALIGFALWLDSRPTANATGTPYTREATITDAHKEWIKRWNYITRFRFDEPLPSGELEDGAPILTSIYYDVCVDHVGERVTVTYDKKGYICDVELVEP